MFWQILSYKVNHFFKNILNVYLVHYHFLSLDVLHLEEKPNFITYEDIGLLQWGTVNGIYNRTIIEFFKKFIWGFTSPSTLYRSYHDG